MSFQIRFNPGTRIVSAIFFGRVELADKLASARQVAEKFGHLHPLMLLVDVRKADIVLSMEERRAFGSFAANLQGLSHGKVAVLHAPDYNANVVINGAAQAEGMRVVEFVTEHAALEWLTSTETHEDTSPH
ncbi:hypothetical protein [Microbulbifer hydrolyticus]|uniref:STAS/SEC14 domain-containing protein n=1 Tax=Microbulbifer hydrolyticus TaxID=48074 RepID=A0A6P1T9S6_9GAMM|nr:hypothetical protein [Microbulbifer hydrolyticus]MBB5212859.1 hypothetical protein [Microbulbifer hydrolyticus]QHQ38350.1 hypothetical protein GTQ55_04640 [Microbulbifer hydrolyticus]